MASEGSTIHSDDPTQSASLIAHAASLKSSMHPWRPRDGKCDDRDLFHDSLVDNMIALGLHPDCVNWPVPTKAAVRKTQPNIREPQVSEMLNAAIIEYQAQGTAIYIMCKPALILTGVHQNEDLEEIRTFTHGKNRDGRGLIEWAEQWCDDTTFDAQSDIRRRMDAIKFISDMTLAQFHTTSRNLYKLWCRIATNDASDPTSFWLLYLHLMPSTPSASHMAQLRTELAKDMTKKDPILLEPPLAFKRLEKLGEAFGMPKGDSANPKAGGRILNALQAPDVPDIPSLNALTAEANSCDTCDAIDCRCKEKIILGKPNPFFGKCHSLPDSKFDVAQLESKGRRVFIMSGRAYWKANPALKSIKGKKFKMLWGKPKPNSERKPVASGGATQMTALMSLKDIFGSSPEDLEELRALLRDSDVSAGDPSASELMDGMFAIGVEDELGTGSQQNDDADPLAPSSSVAETAHQALEAAQAQMASDQATLVAKDAELDAMRARLAHTSSFGNTGPVGAPVARPPNSAALARFTPNPRLVPVASDRVTSPLAAMHAIDEGGVDKSSDPEITNDAGGAKKTKRDRKDSEGVRVLMSKALYQMATEAEKEAKKHLKSNGVLALAARLFTTAASEAWSTLSEFSLSQIIAILAIVRWVLPMLKPHAELLFAQTRHKVVMIMRDMLALLFAKVKQTIPRMILLPGLVYTVGRRLTTLSTNLSAQETATDMMQQTLDAGALLCLSKRPLEWAPAHVAGAISKSAMSLSNDVELEGKNAPVPSDALKRLKAGLHDNGASLGAGCAKSLDGAIRDTFKAVEDISVGNKNKLSAKGSFLYAVRRHGMNGSEDVLRRLNYTPDLICEYVFDEASDVYKFGYEMRHNKREGRVMRKTDSGNEISLWMTSGKLGWSYVEAIKDPKLISELFRNRVREWNARKPTKAMLGLQPVNMSSPFTTKMSPVEFLRYMHIVSGHIAGSRLVHVVESMPKSMKPVILREHWVEFLKQGCGACDSTKPRMPSTGPSRTLIVYKTGMKWDYDGLSLRVPSAGCNSTTIMAYVSKGMRFSFGMKGYTEEDVQLSHGKLRALVRSTHGEIEILKGDSHPSHKGHKMIKYLATSNSNASPVNGQFAPPNFHSGVGEAEGIFRTDVPTAMALLRSAPDLGESHFLQAFHYTQLAAIFVYSKALKMTPYESYYGRAPPPNPLRPFGCNAKAVVSPEVRESKFDEKAKPIIYTGPPRNSADYMNHCSVWNGMEYRDERIASLTFDPSEVIARTMRDHPCHQPFGQRVDEKGNIMTSEEKHAQFDLSSGKEEALPISHWPTWTASDEPLITSYSIGMCAGASRPGDMAAWHYQMTAGHRHIVIDLKIGGYEHDPRNPQVQQALVELASSPYCSHMCVQWPCSEFSPLRFSTVTNGPPPCFTLSEPNGVVGPDGKVVKEAERALELINAILPIVEAAINTKSEVIIEMQAKYGKDSALGASDETAEHSTAKDLDVVKKLMRDHNFTGVITDQCMSGAKTRKPTELLCTPGVLPFVRSILGTLRCNHSTHSATLKGRDAAGRYNSANSEQYTSLFAMRLTTCFLRVLDGADVSSMVSKSKPTEDAVADLYPIGTRIEILWPVDRVWYRATVTSTKVHRFTVDQRRIDTRRIVVTYDVDNESMWHDLHNTDVRESVTAMQTLQDIQSIRLLGNLFVHESTIPLATIQFDMQTGDCTVLHALFALGDTAMDASIEPSQSLDVRYSWSWHTPRTQGEYLRSPQHALWRTARELKIDEYESLHTYTKIFLKTVPKGNNVYRLTWANTIKNMGDAERTFARLNPRLCAVGTSMDREMYPYHAETLRLMSFKGLIALKGGYYRFLCVATFDLGNFFQATRTDFDKSTGEKIDSPDFYTHLAPGFEETGPNGERMALWWHVALQGRIDAAKISNANFWKLAKGLGIRPMLCDSQVGIYHKGPLMDTDAGLNDVILSFASMKEDSPPGHPPLCYATIGLHVDDGICLATGAMNKETNMVLDYTKNRFVAYLQGGLEVEYVVKMTGWQRQLGFSLTCHDDLEMVEMTAPSQLSELADRLLDGVSRYKPKHILMDGIFDIPIGIEPATNDPEYTSFVERRALVQSAVGAGIYLQHAYPKAATLFNVLSAYVHCPHADVLKYLRHGIMHLLSYPDGNWFGGHGFGLEQPPNLRDPYGDVKPMYYIQFSDAGLGSGTQSYTGGVAKLAGGTWNTNCLRQHLAAPESTAAEIVGGGTNLNTVIFGNMFLQEHRIRQGKPTPFYVDSQSLMFVAKGEKSAKRSVWLIRRVKVLLEAVEHNEIRPIHVSEKDMMADIFTKYLKHNVWFRHVMNLHNVPESRSAAALAFLEKEQKTLTVMLKQAASAHDVPSPTVTMLMHENEIPNWQHDISSPRHGSLDGPSDGGAWRYNATLGEWQDDTDAALCAGFARRMVIDELNDKRDVLHQLLHPVDMKCDIPDGFWCFVCGGPDCLADDPPPPTFCSCDIAHVNYAHCVRMATEDGLCDRCNLVTQVPGGTICGCMCTECDAVLED